MVIVYSNLQKSTSGNYECSFKIRYKRIVRHETQFRYIKKYDRFSLDVPIMYKFEKPKSYFNVQYSLTAKQQRNQLPVLWLLLLRN